MILLSTIFYVYVFYVNCSISGLRVLLFFSIKYIDLQLIWLNCSYDYNDSLISRGVVLERRSTSTVGGTLVGLLSQ